MADAKLYDYVLARFDTGLCLCQAPFASMIKEGDLIKVNSLYGKGYVLAVETTIADNSMINFIAKINDPKGEAYKVSAVYSKKNIEWKEEEND